LTINSTIVKIAELNNEDGMTFDNDDTAFYDVFGNLIAPVLSEFQAYNSDKDNSDCKEDDLMLKDDKEN
jgi:hypothetical protein